MNARTLWAGVGLGVALSAGCKKASPPPPTAPPPVNPDRPDVAPPPRYEWRSQDTVFDGIHHDARIPAQSNGPVATLEVYESASDGSVTMGRALDHFVADHHREPFNKTGDYLTVPPAAARPIPDYPYAGKSSVARGEDDHEANAWGTEAAFDLQLHPPENDHLVVAAFVVPLEGDYTVSGLGARRVAATGDFSRYLVFRPNRTQLATLRATNDRAWVRDPERHIVANLKQNDRLYFAVARDGLFSWDATEIAFTITREP